jgi:hypothetical protein
MRKAMAPMNPRPKRAATTARATGESIISHRKPVTSTRTSCPYTIGEINNSYLTSIRIYQLDYGSAATRVTTS